MHAIFIAGRRKDGLVIKEIKSLVVKAMGHYPIKGPHSYTIYSYIGRYLVLVDPFTSGSRKSM